ncbi:hypothetical protein E5676_scaffold29G00680 [Cucumis melo var. makuwa]|uniref:CACTA en-spm transposon protein n=1 Tax=Cucumis melo var. makuwa TaxID=1194695 RepID=A0A5D3BQU3_CUCMM|nr:hypothetical protein E5676_scaffold29G00680 [Cucumis melo var. makuwa]
MLSIPSDFDETDAMFLEFIEDLNNPAEGSSSVGDNLGESNASTPKVGALCSHQWKDSDIASPWHREAYFVAHCSLQPGDRQSNAETLVPAYPRWFSTTLQGRDMRNRASKKALIGDPSSSPARH